MVARDTRGPDHPGPGPLEEFALFWRRLLGRAVPAGAPKAPRPPRPRPDPLRAVGAVVAYVRSPRDAVASADSRGLNALTTVGALAVTAGALLSVPVSRALGAGWLAAFVYVGWLAVWAIVRLAVLRLAAPRAALGTRFEAAWGGALLPFVFAVTRPLDLIALAVSAVLTVRGLEGAGVSRTDAVRCVAFAFGGQLVVELAAWIARSAVFALLR